MGLKCCCQLLFIYTESSASIQYNRGQKEIPQSVKFTLLPFAIFKHCNWLLPHCNSHRLILLLKSNDVNWLLSQIKYVRAMFWLKSNEVSWLLLQDKVSKEVF